MVKLAPVPAASALHELFRKVWTSGHVPSEWKEGTITSLYKGKGAKTDCSSYRLISLLSVPGKVFTHVLLARINPLLKNHRRPQQSGFTAGRLTTELMLYSLCGCYLNYTGSLIAHVAYVDLKSAFNSVDRQAPWKALRGIGMPQVLLKLIEDLHTGTTFRVRLGGQFLHIILCTSGVHPRTGPFLLSN